MSIQIFSGNYGTSPYSEAQGIKYAADNGAVILQCSWGYNSALADAATSMRGFATDEEWAQNCPLEKEAMDYFIHNAGSPNGTIEARLDNLLHPATNMLQQQDIPVLMVILSVWQPWMQVSCLLPTPTMVGE